MSKIDMEPFADTAIQHTDFTVASAGDAPGMGRACRSSTRKSRFSHNTAPDYRVLHAGTRKR